MKNGEIMKTGIKIAMMSLLTFSLVGCNDFLDTTPHDSISDKVVWNDIHTATLYLNGFYPYIDRYGQFGSAQFQGNLTEGLTETFKYGSYVPGNKAGDSNNYVFTPETMSSTGNLLDAWTGGYERIRRINEFLESMRKHSTFSAEENAKLEAQARFFRAFVYFQLAKRHGGVILYTDMNLQKNKDRSSAAETWDLIASDLKYAASVLPVRWDAANKERVTRGAAWAMLARPMLYAERWQDAKDAADSVFKLQVYSLTDKYEDAFKGGNSESILEYNYLVTGPNHTFDNDYVPYGDMDNDGGKGCPTQEMVESYQSKDGKTVDWSKWHGETTELPPYDQLEPRFAATVLYHGAQWKGHTMTNSVGGTYGQYMDYRSDTYPKGRTTTGYYLRKYLDESHTDFSVIKVSTQTWVELRLAEIYLIRAEANYRLGASGAALEDVNAVRQRPGVNLPALSGLSGNDLFKAIRQERKIELAYEGHLYWDMRRWKLADKEYNGYRVHGLKITPHQGAFKFEYVDCDLQDRKFLAKTYVFPIPYDELANNSAIEQYDEWK